MTINRLPGASTASDLNVDIGIMIGWGFDTAGTFQKLQSFTIPAGQQSLSMSVFWPVLSGTPLAYHCDEQVIIRAPVNFQPMMHSTFTNTTDANNNLLGYYAGPPYENMPDGKNPTALFFPDGGNLSSLGVMLPPCAAIYNDLEALLNAL